jgi:hypothetical protein
MATLARRPTDLLEVLRDALARVVWIREEFDPIVRDQALEDLEHDLAGSLVRFDELQEAA